MMEIDRCLENTYSLVRFILLRKGLSDELVGPFLILVLRVGHDARYDERHGDVDAIAQCFE
jgi:hypothetical protein